LWQSTQSGDSWNGYTRTAKYYVSINGGAETAYSVTYTLPKNSTKTIVDVTLTINHKGDGTGSVKVRTWMDTSISAGVVELNKSLTLTTIPKASTIDSLTCTTQYFNGTLTYKYTPKSSSYYNRCVIELNLNGAYTQVKSISLGKKSDSQQTATVALSESELSTIYNKIPNDDKGKLQFTFRTYSDSGYTTQVGEAGNKEITLYIPDDTTTQPTVSMSLSPSSSLPSPYNSLYIQGHSKLKATLGVTTKYGATAEASNITVNGIAYASPYETDILSQEGTVPVKATVKDSRGYYGTNYKDIEVIPYIKPYIQAKSNESSIIAARCDSSASFTDSGTYLKIKAKVVYSKVISGGVQNNYGNIKFRYRKEGGTYSAWQTILNCKTDNSDEVITPPLLNGALDIKSNYQVQIVASDDLYDSVPITIAIPSDDVYMDRPAGGKSMGLGGYSTGDGRLDVYWKTMARGGLSLFDSKGDEIPLDTTMPLPRDQIKGTWDANNLECGVHVVANNNALKQGDSVIMYNGVLIQMKGDVSGNVKLQLALPVDSNRNPMYRLCWYSNWSDWRSMKI
jgi:hypothetical protein